MVQRPTTPPERFGLVSSQTPTLRTPAISLASSRQVRFSLRFWLFPIIYAAYLGIDILITGYYHTTPLNIYLTIAWSLYFPINVIGMIGAYKTKGLAITPFHGTVSNPVVFVIPTIARTNTLPALMRVVDSILLCAPRHLIAFAIHIVTEEDAEELAQLQAYCARSRRVTCLVVPRDYQTAHKTRYKARANQYALEYRRVHALNHEQVFVYHLDDDTGVGHDTIWSIAQVMTENTYDLAQGVLTYPHQLCTSWFCRMADSIRPVDDLARFRFFTGLLRRPFAGLHGEHLLVRASVEDAIGWDFGPNVKVEDAYFGLHFAHRYPGRSTFLRSCCYGASPESVGDLIKQRRRWVAGLLGLVVDPRVPLLPKLFMSYSVVNWTIGLFQNILLVLPFAYLTGQVDTSPITIAILPIWSCNMAYFCWMYIEGLRINLDASQAPKREYYLLPWLMPGLMFVFSVVECWAAFLGCIDFLLRRRAFVVISKRV